MSRLEKIKNELTFLPSYFRILLTRKKRVVYVGCTGMDNLGDEAILEAIKLMFKDTFEFLEIVYANPNKGKMLQRILPSPDFIILGGGTIIKKGENESYLRILKMKISQWPKSKLLVIGPGVVDPQFAEYIGFPVDTIAWNKVLNKAFFLSVRGIHSRSELIKWGIQNEIKILHDPVVFFTKDSIIIKNPKKRIGINFACIGDRIYGRDTKQVKRFALQFVQELLNQKWEVILFPTTRSDISYMLDEIGLKKFKDIKIYEHYNNLNESMSMLESFDLLVGQRLHSIIFAATVGTPFIALSYEPKTLDFLDTIAMKSYDFRVDKLNCNEILGKVNHIYNHLENEQELLHKKMTRAKREQLQVIAELIVNIKS